MGKCPLLSNEDSSEFMRSFAEQVGENTRYLRERYMDPENVLKFSHGHSWEAPANELGDKKGTFQRHGTETKVRLSDIAEGRAHVVIDALNQVTRDMHDQMERMMFETMKAATDQTGQVVNANGRSMPETMYEMLEKMELPLRNDGELSMPSMFIHPSQYPKIMAELDKAGTEFQQRLESLKVKKKEEARIKEQERLARFERL